MISCFRQKPNVAPRLRPDPVCMNRYPIGERWGFGIAQGGEWD